MNPIEQSNSLGWSSGCSIAMELDAALYVACGSLPGGAAAAFSALVMNFPGEWRAEFNSFFGEPKTLQSTLEVTAALAGVVLEEDYSRATLAMRELTLDAALVRLAAQAQAFGLSADVSLPPPQRLVELALRMDGSILHDLGFSLDSTAAWAQRKRQDLERGLRILYDGDLNGRFWHWLDRFYYQVYSPWRISRQGLLEDQEKRLVSVLGARQKIAALPDLTWLPQKNPLLRHAELNDALLSGRLGVFFWIEPFGVADSWTLLPGLVLVSFADAGEAYDKFYDFAAQLAGRVQALADPTRLVILRLIRNLSMTNTDMAAYLGLARPTVSVHAKMLRDAGLIRSHQDGRGVRHEIVAEEVRRLFADLERFLDLPPE